LRRRKACAGGWVAQRQPRTGPSTAPGKSLRSTGDNSDQPGAGP
jgi:hypothetical protein